MPLYEYQCEACQKRFEKIQKYSDPVIEVCPSCGGHVTKLFSSPAIQFKGTGFYITDYAKKSSTDSSKSSSDSSSKSSSATPSSDTSASSSTPAPSTTSDSSSKKE